MDRLGGIFLILLGLASGWFALAGDYSVLMNPAFRWVTVTGACLLLGMGLALARTPSKSSLSALVVFGLFFVMVAVARPELGGVAPLFAPPPGAPSMDRAGYEPMSIQSLFVTMDQEVSDLEGQRTAMRGFVKRLPSLDETQEFVLLEPLMTCCLADAVAFGIRVKIQGGTLPEDGAWVYAFGGLRKHEPPVSTPSFRAGAIAFTPVSRVHQMTADEVVPLQALMDDLFDTTPEDFCSVFLRLVGESGLADALRAEGPFTLFAPHNAAFDAMAKDEREALFADRLRARAFLEGLIVPGQHDKRALYAEPELTTISGARLITRVKNGEIRVGGARILLGHLTARNGLLYVVHPVPERKPTKRPAGN